MEPAGETLASRLRETDIRQPRVPVYPNVTAQPETRPDSLRAGLIDQLTNPVRWLHTLRAMRASGAGRFIEVGPGNVLQGLAKRTLKDVEIAGAGTVAQLAAFAERSGAGKPS